MSVLGRFIVSVKAAIAILFNRYEAGVPWQNGRSYIPGLVADARIDASAITRFEIVRKSRYFERNSAVYNRLVDVFEQYVVGSNGLQVNPASSDEAWNQASKKWWDEWCKVCDLSTRQSFAVLQSLIARTWFVDGEVFILKTTGSKAEGSRPRIQLIESHRVSTPPTMASDEGKTIFDGIEVDANGRPVRYWIRSGFFGEEWKPYLASQVIHVAEPARIGQLRPLPFVYPCLQDLHDLDDLQMLEMQSARQGASISNVLKRQGGAITAQTFFKTAGKTQPNPNDTSKDRGMYVETVTGARTIVLEKDEEFNQFKNERPSDSTRALWRKLEEKVCNGVGIPYVVAFPDAIQGTVYRGATDMAAAFFSSRSAVIASVIEQIWVYVIGTARYTDSAIADAPLDWASLSIKSPRGVDVDVGYNTTAVLARLAAGATTYDDIYSSLGYDWRSKIRQRATESKFINDLAKEMGITPGEIAQSIAAGILQDAQARAMQKQEAVAA